MHASYVFALLALASTVFAQSWPDSTLMEPKDFRAFTLLASSPCNVEVVFKRDVNDVSYDYYLFSADGTAIPQQVPQDDSYNPFSVVSTTAKGQRGAYALGDGYALVPFKVSACQGNNNGPPSAYVMRAVPTGQNASSMPVWTSPQFTNSPNAVVPQGSGASPSATGNGNQVTVSWRLNNPSADQVAGYFVIVGKQFANKLYGTYVASGSATQATVQVDGNAAGYAATVVVYSKDGATTNPSACQQVSVR